MGTKRREKTKGLKVQRRRSPTVSEKIEEGKMKVKRKEEEEKSKVKS